MRAARADIDQLAVGHAHQAAAGDAQHADIERADIGLVAADPRILHRRPAVADHADVGAGAADFEIDAVRDAQMHQRAGDARGRAGQHGHGRTAAHLVHVHHATVAAHDHQRRRNARLAHALLRHVGGLDHARQDAGVDHRGAGARRKAVELGDLVAAGHRQAERGRSVANRLLVRAVVDTEGAGGDDHLRALLLQRAHGVTLRWPRSAPRP